MINNNTSENSCKNSQDCRESVQVYVDDDLNENMQPIRPSALVREDNEELDEENEIEDEIDQPVEDENDEQFNNKKEALKNLKKKIITKKYTECPDLFYTGEQTSKQKNEIATVQDNFNLLIMKENEYKVFLIGNYGVGKTEIISMFTNKKRDELNVKEKFTKSIQMNKETKIDFTIEDTAGIEKTSKVLPKQFFKDLDGIIAVFDVTDKESFTQLGQWINFAIEHSPSDAVLFIVGNKIDMNTIKVIQENTGNELAAQYNATYVEVSAKTGANIDLLFEDLANKIYYRQKDNRVSISRKVRRNQTQCLTRKKRKRDKIKECCSSKMLHSDGERHHSRLRKLNPFHKISHFKKKENEEKNEDDESRKEQ